MAELHVLARIPSTGVRSLIWEGDSLVDWVAGGSRFLLDGTIVTAIALTLPVARHLESMP
jgi:hypothetical protein